MVIWSSETESDQTQSVFVDRWPEFNAIVCKPQYEQVSRLLTLYVLNICICISAYTAIPHISIFLQKGYLFKDIPVFAIDQAILEDIITKSNVLDWTQFICIGNTFFVWMNNTVAIQCQSLLLQSGAIITKNNHSVNALIFAVPKE